MKSDLIVVILLTIVIIITLIKDVVNSKREQSIPDILIYTGITLIVTGIPNILDRTLEIVADLSNVTLSHSQIPDILNMAVGIVLLVMGIILKVNLKDKLYVLNMYGVAVQKDISEKIPMSDLKLVEFKLKEQIIDVVNFFNGGINLSSKQNEYICKQIQINCDRFCAKTTDQNSACFTGMAPIPYTVYAGTFLENSKISRYFEYDAQNGGHYYELKKAKRKAKWDSLKIKFVDSIKDDSEDVILAISISHRISEEDLKQFNGEIVEVLLSEPKDNAILYIGQLIEYKKLIYNLIEDILPQKYPKLKRLHIVASIPSCMSIEIGKSIGVRTNRLSDVIVYHYIASQNPRYVFGLYVNGDKKGKMFERK